MTPLHSYTNYEGKVYGTEPPWKWSPVEFLLCKVKSKPQTGPLGVSWGTGRSPISGMCRWGLSQEAWPCARGPQRGTLELNLCLLSLFRPPPSRPGISRWVLSLHNRSRVRHLSPSDQGSVYWEGVFPGHFPVLVGTSWVCTQPFSPCWPPLLFGFLSHNAWCYCQQQLFFTLFI